MWPWLVASFLVGLGFGLFFVLLLTFLDLAGEDERW